MPHELRVRAFREGDAPALLEVHRSAIRQIAARDYTPEQIAAWAPDDIDFAAWEARMRHNQPFVALKGETVVGYADLQPNGLIVHFFVSGAYPRQGIGTKLMSHIHDKAQQQGLAAMCADVSATAEGFFLHHGFMLVRRQHLERQGVLLHNARMRKQLHSAITA